MSMTGYTEVREEPHITHAVVERVKYLQEVAICPKCKKDGGGTFSKSAAPTALMPHSPISPSAGEMPEANSGNFYRIAPLSCQEES